jgi:hypothetical protein
MDGGQTSWVGVVDLGHDAAGKRTRRKVSAATKTEARRKLEELRQLAGKTGTVPRADLTVAAVVGELMVNPPPSWRSPITTRVYSCLAARIIQSLGAVKITQLTVPQVEGFPRHGQRWIRHCHDHAG